MNSTIGAFAPYDKDIQRMSAAYGVPVTKIMDLLIGSEGDSEAGNRLASLSRRLEFSGASYWKFRVRHSPGVEALFDQDLRFLAVSKQGRTLTPPNGKVIELPEHMFIGTKYSDLLPTKDSFLGDAYPGLDGLKGLGFFAGAFAGLKLRLEMNFGFHFLHCDMELWPVRTPDQGVLGHSQMHRLDPDPACPRAAGIKVHSMTFC